MSSLFAFRAMLFAGELFLGSVAILAIGWLGSTQKAAATRHLWLAGTFGALFALPLLLLALPSELAIVLPAPPPPLPAEILVNAAFIPAPPNPADSAFVFTPATVALALGALWLAVACLVLVRFLVGALGLTLLKRRSRLYALAPGDEPHVASHGRECELRLGDRDTGPVTWGLLRPVILLPKTALQWSRDRLHAVLLHELAHIRRRDCLVQTLSHLACALYWPNPLVWVAARKLRQEAEIAADDAVIRAGLRPSQYAGELVELARSFRSPAFSNIAFFMAAPSALEARVESVLSPNQLRTGVTSMDVLKVIGVSLFASAAIAYACPSLAQDTPPPAPVVSAPPAPPAPAAPPAIPAPSADDTGAAPPAPPSPPSPPDSVSKESTLVYVDGHDWSTLSPEEKKKLHIKIVKLRHDLRHVVVLSGPEIDKSADAVKQAHVTLQLVEPQMQMVQSHIDVVQPQIDAAIADIGKHQDEINKMVVELTPEIRVELARIRPEVAKAMAEARASIAKAHLDAQVQAKVDAALRRAQEKIERAESQTKTIDEDTDSGDDATSGPDHPDHNQKR